MADISTAAARSILTPDQRLRVFVSSTFDELAAERQAAARTISALRLSPVLLEAGARPYPPRELYRSYLEQSHVFVGIYGNQYGWVAPDAPVSALEDEYRLAAAMPRLLYLKAHGQDRDPRLEAMLDDIRATGETSYRTFGDADELAELLADDLAVLLTERFTEGLASRAAPAAVTSRPVPTVPLAPSRFVGRDAELRRLEQLLGDPQVRIVTVCGPGGVGKTRIALEAAHRTRDRFPDGAIVVWLDALRESSLVLETLAAQLEISETAQRDVVETIGGWLSGKRMLLILDNFEHVMAAAPAVARLMSYPTASKVLVTSRELLRIRGERAIELAPLQLPDAGTRDTASLSDTEAVAFFVDRAAAASPGFALTADNAGVVVDIVRRLDGVPLALELAGARLKLLPPRALLDRLEAGLDLPGQSARDLPERQRTLRATIDWSYSLLDDAERRALQRLAVFVGGADLDAAVDALSDVGADALELLASLTDKSLVQREASAAGVRLRLLASIRRYAAEQLSQHDDEAAARDRHAAWFSNLATDLARRLHSADQAECLTTFRREEDNLQAALEWYWSQRRTAEGMALANALRWFWLLRGHLTIAEHWLGRLLTLESGDGVQRGQTLVTAAMIAVDCGEFERARGLYEEAITLLDSAGDADGLAWARTGLGAVLMSTGSPDEAEALQDEALAMFRQGDDLLGQCAANTRRAVLSVTAGEFDEAERRFLGSLEVRRRIGDPYGTSYVLTSLGLMRLVAGDVDAADGYYAEAVDLARTIGYSDGIATALDGLAAVAAARGAWDRAEELLVEATARYGEVGNRAGLARVLAHRASVELQRSDPAAPAHSRAAFDEAMATGDAAALVAALGAVASALARRGDLDMAATLLGAALEIRRRDRVPSPIDDPLAAGQLVHELRDALGDARYAAMAQAGATMSAAALTTTVAATSLDVTDSLAPT